MCEGNNHPRHNDSTLCSFSSSVILFSFPLSHPSFPPFDLILRTYTLAHTCTHSSQLSHPLTLPCLACSMHRDALHAFLHACLCARLSLSFFFSLSLSVCVCARAYIQSARCHCCLCFLSPGCHSTLLARSSILTFTLSVLFSSVAPPAPPPSLTAVAT